MSDALPGILSPPARQQPDWADDGRLRRVREELAVRPPLVRPHDVRRLKTLLARVARGEAQVVQAGDCSEDPAECTAGYLARKAGLLDVLAGVMKMAACMPVLRVGRIAGQFAKPRSRPIECVNGVELPVYRGHMVNGPEPDPAVRRPDPERLLSGYDAARTAMRHLNWLGAERDTQICPPLWTSHEALLLDYELPMVRPDEHGRPVLTSTHWPWVGERTRQVEGAHVALLARIGNPVACKVGPTAEPADLLALCEALDPLREPGRLTFIARMGADAVADRLPPLVRAVRNSGHPVIWLCDPMHGNTVTTGDGLKTRLVRSVVCEISGFRRAVHMAGGIAGGLHLETTPDDVTECVIDASGLGSVGDKYTTLCDPRLNPAQAVSIVSAWQG
ncbi:3-deoxy-7-phosphoheptulonate synthase [Sphaerimonospora thailandensis]|uniref:3-deoxy-7-phosphoheptulonate synthase n=1 Tax=Sphaerimonospora thailandensis TaxID=795644 RepID=UPI001EF2B231|nr:3-deoxy-7-phosphoheptulonate synthase [Sphaerimonospora thailandensis]